MKNEFSSLLFALGILGVFLPLGRASENAPQCADQYHLPADFLPNPDESELIARAIGWCRNQKFRLLWDERYASVAHTWSQHLLSADPSTGRMIPVDRIRFDLQRAGVTDAHVAPFSVVDRFENQPTNLIGFLDREIRRGRYNIFGIGTVRSPDQKNTAVTLLLGRRQTVIDPLPACPVPSERIDLRLRLAPGYRHPSWLLAQPDGMVIKGILKHQEGIWKAMIGLDAGRGTYQMEILVHGLNGPEIAALFPLYVGTAKPGLPVIKLRPAPNRYPTPKEAEKALIDLIDSVRSRHNLPKLIVCETLNSVARRHSLDLLNRRHAVHRTSSGSLHDRLKNTNIPFIRALENVSLSTSPETAHERFLESPSHRINILDPNTTHLGIGIAMERSLQEDILSVCEVFIEKTPPADLANIKKQLFTMINQTRKNRGRFALGLDTQLSRYALESARRLSANPTRLDPQKESLRLVEDIENSNLTVTGTRVHMLRTANPKRALTIPALLDENVNRIGIGIAKADNTHKPPELWISLIFAGR